MTVNKDVMVGVRFLAMCVLAYLFSIAFDLLNQPNDMAVIAGIFMTAGLLVILSWMIRGWWTQVNKESDEKFQAELDKIRNRDVPKSNSNEGV